MKGAVLQALSAFLCCALLAPAPVDALQEPAQESDLSRPATQAGDEGLLEGLLGIPVHGTLYAKYRFRSNWDDKDSDLYEYLSLDIGDKEKFPVTAHLFARATEDLDRHRNHSEFYSFDSITDTFDSSVNGRLYYAYVDVHEEEYLEVARIGRQFIQDTVEVFHLDGARVESKACPDLLGLKLGVYGGLPVHLYESSPSGDYLVGGFAEIMPLKGSRARIDYTRIRDAYLNDTHRNDLYGLSFWQSVGRNVQLHYRHVFLEDTSRDHLARVTAYCPEWDIQLQLSFYQLLETYQQLAIDLDSFYLAAQEYRPFWEIRALVSKAFGEHFSVDAGAHLRELDHENDQGVFNHEFRRFYVSPSLSEWPWKGFEISLVGDLWEVPGQDNGDTRTAGGEVGYRLLPELMVSGGSSYSLYKFDYYTEQERRNVRTYYARARIDLPEGFRIEPRYEYENSDYDDDDLEDSHTFILSVRKTF